MASGDIIRIGGGLDLSEYIPFHIPVTTITSTTAFQTVYEVNGEGYLVKALVNGSNSGIQYKGRMRITIDGVVIFNGSSTATASSYCGVSLSTDTGATLSANSTTLGFTTDVVDGRIFRTPFPIFFKESLKIEVSISGNGLSHSYEIAGGLK